MLSDESTDDKTKLAMLVARIDPMLTTAVVLDHHLHEMDRDKRFEMTPEDLAVIIPFCEQLMDRELAERSARLVAALFGSEPTEVNAAQSALEMELSKSQTKH